MAIATENETAVENVTGASEAAEAVENAEAENIGETVENAQEPETAAADEPVADDSLTEPRKSSRDKTGAGIIFASLIAMFMTVSEAFKSAFKCVKRNAKSVLPACAKTLYNFGGLCIRIIKTASVRSCKAIVRGIRLSAQSFARQIKTIISSVINVLIYIGHSGWHILYNVTSAVIAFVLRLLGTLFGTVWGWLKKKFKQPLYDIWCAILTPFAHAYGAAAHAHLRLKKAKKHGFWHAFRSALSSFWGFLGGLCNLLRFSFNYIAPVVSIIFLISLIRYSATIQYAISVEYNGSEIGTIDNEAKYNEAQALIQDKITFTDEAHQIAVETPRFSVTVLNLEDSEQKPIEDIDRLSELMIQGSETQIAYAYGLYVNGELFGVYSVEDMEKIRDALNDRLNMYNTPETVDVRFEDDIVMREGRFIQDVIVPADSAIELINGSTEVETYYKAVSGDTVAKICAKLGITEEDFKKYNPGLSGSIEAGVYITYHYFEPHLNVLTTHYEVYDQVIERTTEYVESSKYEQYCEILLQHGSDGYENVTAMVVEKNGTESERTVISRTILEEMVPRKFRIGTAENTYLKGDTKIIDKFGTFCWPVGDEKCYISSVYGYRSWDRSNHGAIDIAGIPRGTPIYAACDGKVTFSGTSGDYGKLVIVDIGKGYECYYGHCSELLVDVGDRVEKGDIIAEVGMTGRASGNHLHFEMRYDNERINPLLALGGPGGHRYNMA